MREHFSRLWDNFDDPIAEFEKTSSSPAAMQQ